MGFSYEKKLWQRAFIKVEKALVYALVRPKVEWKDKRLKRELEGTEAVFVCNHTHHFDGPVLSAVLEKFKPYMLVKKSWYEKGGTGALIRACRSIPTDTDGMDTSWYKLCEGAAERGCSLLIFPEGGIARDGKPESFKPGAAMLAAKRGAVIVPTASLGEYKLLFGKRQKILIGEPIECKLPKNVRASAYAKQVSRVAEKKVFELYAELEAKYGKGKVYYDC